MKKNGSPVPGSAQRSSRLQGRFSHSFQADYRSGFVAAAILFEDSDQVLPVTTETLLLPFTATDMQTFRDNGNHAAAP